jgi:hypothetical protein
MKRYLAIFLALMLLFSSIGALAETAQAAAQEAAVSGKPPAMPGGSAPGGAGPGGAPGGGSSQPESYSAVNEYSEDQTLDNGAYASTGTDENAILVSGGTVKITNATITRTSSDSSGGDSASFYGVGAALLVTGGTATITGGSITTDASGGAGVFAYGDGTAYISNTIIDTVQGASGGIHVAGGGTLYAKDLTVETDGNSAAAIRSDRGGGTMVVDGGTYISNGAGSPAVYCTADISIHNATLTTTGSEALCLEGLNTVRLYDSILAGNMPDQEQNDNTWTVILYQSMSGDSMIGEGKFEMTGGSIASENGGLFYTTNTESEFILSGVDIAKAGDSEYFLRCTGNANQRGWGNTGANGADCTFTGISQQMNGNIIWDSISKLDLYALSGSVLTGAVIDDETYAGSGGDGYCNLYIDSGSSWIVTGNSTVTTLNCAGKVIDTNGNTVTIAGADGTVYVQGNSQYTVTVFQYIDTCDISNAGTPSSWSDHEVAF